MWFKVVLGTLRNVHVKQHEAKQADDMWIKGIKGIKVIPVFESFSSHIHGVSMCFWFMPQELNAFRFLLFATFCNSC